MSTEHEAKDEISALMESYKRFWNAMNFSELEGLFDAEEKDIVYLAEEIAEPMIGLDRIREYWSANTKLIDTIEIATDPPLIKLVAPGIALIFFGMRWRARLRGVRGFPVKPVAGDVNVTALLRRKKAGWRFFHYTEAPLGALPFLRRAYQERAEANAWTAADTTPR